MASHHELGDMEVQPGSLWQLVNKEAEEPEENVLRLTSLESDNLQMQCSIQEVANISEQEVKLLTSIDANAERSCVYKERGWLLEGIDLSVDDVVYVLNKDEDLPNCPQQVTGKIRYKGMVSGRKGEWFGIELSVVSIVVRHCITVFMDRMML